MATAAILMLATCPMVRPNSPLMIGISGAQANQAKKHTKNAIQVRWKARICGVLNVKSAILSALVAMFYPVKNKKASGQTRLKNLAGRTPLSCRSVVRPALVFWGSPLILHG